MTPRFCAQNRVTAIHHDEIALVVKYHPAATLWVTRLCVPISRVPALWMLDKWLPTARQSGSKAA
jgi:hypothetical protein